MHLKYHILILLFTINISTAVDINASEPLVIKKIMNDIDFDGSPFEKVWNEVTPLPMTMYMPNFGAEPTEKTEVRIFYNADFLYVSARLYDKEASKISSLTKKRDEYSGNSDGFGIIIDSFNDTENALAFLTYPSGSRMDFTVFNDAVGGFGRMPFNESWNTFWDVKTIINDQGWFVEIRIPISSLRFQEENNEAIMGLILWRWIPHKDEMQLFPAIDPKYGEFASMKPSKAREVIFKDIKSKKPIYLTPYLLTGFNQQSVLNSSETLYEYESDPIFKIGGDLKYGITPNLTMDLTINTDFAQVEADDQQVNLTRYSLFFPEKRQFFQERSSVFSFSLGGPQNLFYSRRIGLHEGEEVQIYGGARIVGRVGKWDLGFLDMQTAPLFGKSEINNVQDSILLNSENFGVLRMRRQVINENSYIGGIITSRVGSDGSYNLVYGLDGIFRLFGDDYLDIKWAQTFETGNKNNPLSMDPAKFRIQWERRNDKGFAYTFSVSHSGTDFNPGIGFEMRNDYNGTWNIIQWGWLPGTKSKLQSHKVFVRFKANTRVLDNSLESAAVEPGWTFQSKSFFQGNFRFRYLTEDLSEDFEFSDDAIIPAGRYHFITSQLMLSTPMSSPFYILNLIDAGQFYDGSRISFNIEPTWSISSSLALSGTYQFNYLSFPARAQSFNAYIGRFKILYVLNTKITFSAFIQYNSDVDAISTNFRFRYNPREGNDLYLVFNEGRNTDLNREVPALSPVSNRNIMIKYTYTFRL
jgi:hypothetical protein